MIRMTFRPANYFYANYNLPRGFLRDLVERGLVNMHEVVSVDGVNMMKLYCVEDVDKALSSLGGTTNGEG